MNNIIITAKGIFARNNTFLMNKGENRKPVISAGL